MYNQIKFDTPKWPQDYQEILVPYNLLNLKDFELKFSGYIHVGTITESPPQAPHNRNDIQLKDQKDKILKVSGQNIKFCWIYGKSHYAPI